MVVMKVLLDWLSGIERLKALPGEPQAFPVPTYRPEAALARTRE
jgi:hypothetical protein